MNIKNNDGANNSTNSGKYRHRNNDDISKVLQTTTVIMHSLPGLSFLATNETFRKKWCDLFGLDSRLPISKTGKNIKRKVTDFT